MQNVKQFNGEFGCDWCEFEGVTLPKNSGPPVRYYPYRFPVVMRSARNQAAYAVEATAGNPVKGVKGMTVADLLPTFNTVRGTVADYTHSVCQGVMRQMVDLWFNPKNHGESYYIGKEAKLVDERLQLISPPNEIHRSPRSISKRLHWKASEWRAFIFYSLIVLRGILPRSFLNHYFLFVYGIYFIDINFSLSSSPYVTDALARLTDHSRFKHSGVSDGLKFIGCGLLITLDALMLLALENLLNLNVGNSCATMYDRFVYNHKFYSSIHYTQSKRHTNHHVAFQDSILKYGRITGLVSIKPLCCCTLEISQYCKCAVYNIVLVKIMNPSHRILFRDGDFKVTSNFLIELEESDDIIAIYPSQIKRKCICIKLARKMYYCPLPYRIYDD